MKFVSLNCDAIENIFYYAKIHGTSKEELLVDFFITSIDHIFSKNAFMSKLSPKKAALGMS